ncbi:hypothetical protein DRW03_09615 [Corallococcus sp. H22C18031201]|nr:hypothetical protein DRW03_09615 [Corallococcus sp. H22C18031201]
MFTASRGHAAPHVLTPESDDARALESQDEDGAISEDAWDGLRLLRRTGVDPRSATRGWLYALPGLTYARVDALLRAESSAPGGLIAALSDEERRTLRPYWTRERPAHFSGDVRLLTAFAMADRLMPPLALQARARSPDGWSVGLLAALARRRFEPPTWEPRREVLVVSPPHRTVVLPKLYVQGTFARARVLVGAFRLGFGQRLTLDTTGLPTPEGFVPDDEVRGAGAPERWCFLGAGACDAESQAEEVTPDFRWSEGFRGAAATVRGVVGERAEGVLTAFGSYQSRSLSSSMLREAGPCKGRSCPAVPVWVEKERTPQGTLSARLLPGVFREWAGGGNATLRWSSRVRVGATAWGARPVWSVEGASLDFRPSAGYPMGGGFGAAGVDAAVGAGPVDLFLEVARSFDSAPEGGGGVGVVQRTVLSAEEQELELLLRYYARGFANPYTGAPAGADSLEGSRARNELGARARYVQRLGRSWRARGQVDAWALPEDGAAPGTAGTVRLRASARVDWTEVSWLQPSLWGEYQDSGVGESGDCVERAGGAPCADAGLRVTGRVESRLGDAVSLAAQLGVARTRDSATSEARDETRAVLDLRLRPHASLRLRGRLSWTRPQRATRASTEVAWDAHRAVSVRARYAWELEAGTERVPTAVSRHVFQLEWESRF